MIILTELEISYKLLIRHVVAVDLTLAFQGNPYELNCDEGQTPRPDLEGVWESSPYPDYCMKGILCYWWLLLCIWGSFPGLSWKKRKADILKNSSNQLIGPPTIVRN